MSESGDEEEAETRRGESLIPTSGNPLTTVLNFVVAILYTFVLQDLLRAAFRGVNAVFDWRVFLTVVVLLEILHYAIEDYLYTDAREDPLNPETLDFAIAKFVAHFVGVVCLLASAYAVVFALRPASSAGLLSTGGTRELAAYVLFGVALQQATFAAWQALDLFEAWRLGSTDTEEAEHWIPRFGAYAIIEGVTACSLLNGWLGDGTGFVPLVGLGLLWGLDRKLGPYRETEEFPTPDGIPVTWQHVQYGAFVALLLTAFAPLAVRNADGALAALTVGFLLVTVKSRYLHHWTGYYHDLFGTRPGEETDGGA